MGTLRGLQSTRLKQLHHRRMLEGLGSHLSGAPGLQKKTFSTRKRHNKRLFAFVGQIHDSEVSTARRPLHYGTTF